MDNLRGLLDIRRIDRVLDTQIKEFCGAKKVADEMTDENFL